MTQDESVSFKTPFLCDPGCPRLGCERERNEMKHAFETSILCNESEFPTYPRPTTARGGTRNNLNWTFLDGSSTSATLRCVSVCLFPMFSSSCFYSIRIQLSRRARAAGAADCRRATAGAERALCDAVQACMRKKSEAKRVKVSPKNR